MKDKNYFLKKAEENRPQLFFRKIVPDAEQFLAESGNSIVLDLKEHAVGHFSFKFDNYDDFIDAPVRMTIKFGEDLYEINREFSTYEPGLSKTWLQEEILNIDLPGEIKMPRRYSCRYIKITVDFIRKPIVLSDFCFTASTSADITQLEKAETNDEMLGRIDEVATDTLKECMQVFLEDGPKRDRRLWTGDLRLEALTNYYTFNNNKIVRRCLYLFAAGETDELGFLPSYIYETPYYFSGRAHIADYALLFVVTLCDYYEHTADGDTVDDLLTICKSQLDCFEKILDENLIVTPQKGWFSFIDWCPGLKALTALQGVYLYTLERFADLLEKLGDCDCKKYSELLKKVRLSSKTHLFDENKKAFINYLDEYQFNIHSQVWMILGGVIDGEEAKELLLCALESEDAKQPVTPYMQHYVVEAMLKLGMKKEATEYLKNFWGGMIELGADTFWEAYVPGEPDFSPYNDRLSNSLCHAWSCTPSYFIRKYNL